MMQDKWRIILIANRIIIYYTSLLELPQLCDLSLIGSTARKFLAALWLEGPVFPFDRRIKTDISCGIPQLYHYSKIPHKLCRTFRSLEFKTTNTKM